MWATTTLSRSFGSVPDSDNEEEEEEDGSSNDDEPARTPVYFRRGVNGSDDNDSDANDDGGSRGGGAGSQRSDECYMEDVEPFEGNDDDDDDDAFDDDDVSDPLNETDRFFRHVQSYNASGSDKDDVDGNDEGEEGRARSDQKARGRPNGPKSTAGVESSWEGLLEDFDDNDDDDDDSDGDDSLRAFLADGSGK